VGFWEEKLATNRARDARNVAALVALGWRTVVFWECEVRDENRLNKAIDGLIQACDS
jgi:DNA mismatch endonuclease (patch repair protein)